MSLCKIGTAESDMCECGRAPETMEHFLFRCTRWETEREVMRQAGQSMMGNLSYFLGGKSASDGPKWTPNLKAVRAAVKFAMATGRLSLMLTDHASAAGDRMLNTWRNRPSSRPVKQSQASGAGKETSWKEEWGSFGWSGGIAEKRRQLSVATGPMRSVLPGRNKNTTTTTTITMSLL
ncbi:hypothetical protein MRS44_013742 [Fusarium solani]|uniref:uncharacterized protein n=1 Tax=Fusarium solani TaxID=169388 RepID=UPI0032C43A78|nr:hypothetical protein MRS44_013742 [Fusarium solani]